MRSGTPDCPKAYNAIQSDDPSTVLIRGESCIVDPLGNVLVEPNFEGEITHLADLDRRIIARGKYDLDVTGHYARPDVFNLTVDARPKSPVSFATETSDVAAFGFSQIIIAAPNRDPAVLALRTMPDLRYRRWRSNGAVASTRATGTVCS